jgi:hypothetical protein
VIDYTINWLLTFPITGLLGILLYWVPMAMLIVVGIIDFFKYLEEDRQAAEQYRLRKTSSFNPQLTLGSIFGYLCMIAIPFINVIAATFYALPIIWKKWFYWCGKFWSISIIAKPERIEKPEQPEQPDKPNTPSEKVYNSSNSFV